MSFSGLGLNSGSIIHIFILTPDITNLLSLNIKVVAPDAPILIAASLCSMPDLIANPYCLSKTA
jgi:hypothetical protein